MKAETAETVMTEPVKTETVMTKPVKTETVMTEPVKTETVPAVTEPVKVEVEPLKVYIPSDSQDRLRDALREIYIEDKRKQDAENYTIIHQGE